MLYVRHSKKSYKNGASKRFPLDPPLTDDGWRLAESRFRELVDRYGPPELIISSPYLRTRETAKIAQQAVLESTGTHVEINYDPAIGEYLGNQTSISLEDGVTPETLALNPIPHETLNQYRYRVGQHVRGPKFRHHSGSTTRRGSGSTTRRGRRSTTRRGGVLHMQGSNAGDKHCASLDSDSSVEESSIESQVDTPANVVNVGPKNISPTEDINRNPKHNPQKPETSSDVWYISHGTVIKSIAHFNGFELKYPKPLGGILIKDGTVTAI